MFFVVIFVQLAIHKVGEHTGDSVPVCRYNKYISIKLAIKNLFFEKLLNKTRGGDNILISGLHISTNYDPIVAGGFFQSALNK